MAVQSSSKVPELATGLQYWEKISADVNGVLGGYGSISRVDALGSRMFLLRVMPYLSTIPSPGKDVAPIKEVYRALDVGAGIGRVTKTVLLPLFDRVDVAEPVEAFLVQARTEAPSWPGIKPESDAPRPRGVRLWKKTLQELDPKRLLEPRTKSDVYYEAGATDGWEGCDGYSVIWCQWTLGHLSDDDLVSFLVRCSKALRPPNPADGGRDACIIVKENICVEGSVFDDEDSSVTRSEPVYQSIFERAGLRLVLQDTQRGLPAELFAVQFFLLRRK